MTGSSYRGPERRKYMRLDADCAVNYLKLSKDLKSVKDVTESSYSEDISAGGLKFKATEPYVVGTVLELQIKIPLTEQFITAIGKVVRSTKKDKDSYEIALLFIWIKDKDIKVIDDYVKRKELERIQSELDGR